MTVFEACVSSIGSAEKAAGFRRAQHMFESSESDYWAAAREHVLFRLPASMGGNDDMLFEGLSKSDLKGLYSGQMVPAGKAARDYYDKLVVSSPLRKCPFCGFGRATTLDHFLAKAHYPWLAIIPANLVPACKDCNHGKSARRAESADAQVLHPYFEGPQIAEGQWLFASVVQETPPLIDYRAEPPAGWDPYLRQRVARHFEDFDLKARFAVEAAAELATLRFTLKPLAERAGRLGVQQHLADVASGERKSHTNSWKTALYQALSQSDWYIEGGYLME